MAAVTPGRLPTLDTYAAAVWSHKWRFVICGLLGAVIATSAFFALPYRYVSISSIALSPQVTYVAQDATDNKPTFVTLDTVAYLARSDRVISRVAEAMGVSPAEARRSMTVTAQPLSTVLRIHVRADTKEAANKGSRAAAQALVDEQTRALALQQTQIHLLRKRLSALRTQVLNRSAAGSDPSTLLADTDVMEQRLQEAVASNRRDSLVIKRHYAMASRPGQVEVFATGGLVAGVLLAGLVTVAAGGRRKVDK